MIYNGGGAPAAMRCNHMNCDSDSSSALHLPCRLIDQHFDHHAFPAAAATCAPHRGRPEIVEPDRDAYMGVGCADAIGGIERDPADGRHIRLRPGVAGVLLRHAVCTVKIAA